MSRRRSFDRELARITHQAIDDSQAEIETAMVERFGDQPSEGDWWKPDPEDPFWMLEVRQGFDGAGAWLKNEHTFLTTRDPCKALRYPSRWAASCAQNRLYPEQHRFEPTEHAWIVPLASAGETEGEDREDGLRAEHEHAASRSEETPK